MRLRHRITAHYTFIYENNDKLDLIKNYGEVSLGNNFFTFCWGGVELK